MKSHVRLLAWPFLSVTASASIARAQEPAEPEPEKATASADLAGAEAPKQCEAEEEQEYGSAGVIEIGGNSSLDWTKEELNVDLSPSIGYFIADKVELSAIFTVEFDNVEDPETGNRHTHDSYSILLEPSYHARLRDGLYLLTGLGVGVGYNEHNKIDAEIVPRVGLNIGLSRGSFVTPAVTAPITIDSEGTLVGFGAQLGYSYAW